MVTHEAITIDSRFFWRARTESGGFYWKTFDIFTQGEDDIDAAYREGDVTYPFWSNPIPKFIANQGGTVPEDLSYVATLPLGVDKNVYVEPTIWTIEWAQNHYDYATTRSN